MAIVGRMAAELSPLYLSRDERPAVADDDILAIVLVSNGPLGMSHGKLAAQCFQAAIALYTHAEERPFLGELLDLWAEQGWRTVVRVAETETIWQRVLDECAGIVLRDEGLTEVADGSKTVFCSYPLRRGEMPSILRNKKLPLLV